MPFSDPIKAREYDRQWRIKNKEKILAQRRTRYHANPERSRELNRMKNDKMREYMAQWHQENKVRRRTVVRERYQRDADYRQKMAIFQRKYNQQSKMLVIDHYGGKCACCGENNSAFLAIDHIYGNGKKHRESLGLKNGSGGIMFYRWIIRNDYPSDLQVLCHNCNQAKGLYGKCPHESIVRDFMKDRLLRAV